MNLHNAIYFNEKNVCQSHKILSQTILIKTKQGWKIPSEEYYRTNQKAYYEAINLGVNFYELDYTNCITFFKMLSKCLKILYKA